MRGSRWAYLQLMIPSSCSHIPVSNVRQGVFRLPFRSPELHFYATFASSFEAPSEFHVALQGSSEGSIIPRATLKGSFVGSSSSSFALWGLFHEFQHSQHCSPGFLCDLWTSLQNSVVSSSVLSTTLKSSSVGYPYLHVGPLAPQHL
ncbi:hypothetical protein AMECASPLE_034921 [Ameca splendens]|uniref:Uncharacterized protein n=1 Tax=Ameca splendens TaxID=208324 RepID=A0ABV0XKB7_9TELE